MEGKHKTALPWDIRSFTYLKRTDKFLFMSISLWLLCLTILGRVTLLTRPGRIFC